MAVHLGRHVLLGKQTASRADGGGKCQHGLGGSRRYTASPIEVASADLLLLDAPVVLLWMLTSRFLEVLLMDHLLCWESWSNILYCC